MTTEEIKQYILSNCNDCEGRFYEIDIRGKDTIIKNCKCYPKLLKYSKYNESGINIEWWDFTINDVEKDFDKKVLKDVKFFIDNIKSNIVNKSQFFFYGDNGVGKSTMALLMLKAVIDSNYKGIFVNSKDIIHHLYNGDIDLYDDKDFIVIDELDKIRSNVVNDFCFEVLSFMDKKSLVLISNQKMEWFKSKVPTFFFDRLKSTYSISFPDRNYRKQFKSKFEALKDTYGK